MKITSPNVVLEPITNSQVASEPITQKCSVTNIYWNIIKDSISTNPQSLSNRDINPTSLLSDFYNEDLSGTIDSSIVSSFFDINKLRKHFQQVIGVTKMTSAYAKAHPENVLASTYTVLTALITIKGFPPIIKKMKETNHPQLEHAKSLVIASKLNVKKNTQLSEKNYFHPLTHFNSYLIKNNQKIDCSNRTNVKLAIFSLLKVKQLLIAGIPCKTITLELIEKELKRIENAFKSYVQIKMQEKPSVAAKKKFETKANEFLFECLFDDPFSHDCREYPPLLELAKSYPKLVKSSTIVITPELLEKDGIYNIYDRIDRKISRIKFKTTFAELVCYTGDSIPDELSNLFTENVSRNPNLKIQFLSEKAEKTFVEYIKEKLPNNAKVNLSIGKEKIFSMLTSSISPQDNAIRQLIANKGIAHTESKKPINHCACIIDGDFSSGFIILPSGEQRIIRGTKYTAINSKTFITANLVKAINEGRLAVFVTGKGGDIKEVNIHPDWMKKMKEDNALNILLRTNLNEPHSWVEENDTIGIASVQTQKEYEKMVEAIGFDCFLNK